MQETSLDPLVHTRCFLNDTEETLSESISTALEFCLWTTSKSVLLPLYLDLLTPDNMADQRSHSTFNAMIVPE